VGTNPQDVTYAPDGRYVYTANVESGTVSVVDTQTRTVTANIPTDSPTSVAVLPNGRKAYVTNLKPVCHGLAPKLTSVIAGMAIGGGQCR
jgi:YVTN family beta-propeller protein